MTSEKEQVRPDGSEHNHPHVTLEQNDTQRPCSREHNDRILQDTILTNDLCNQREKEKDLNKMNSEVSES